MLLYVFEVAGSTFFTDFVCSNVWLDRCPNDSDNVGDLLNNDIDAVIDRDE